MADAQGPLAQHRPQLQLDGGGIGQGAFRADQDVGQVHPGIDRVQSIQIVAADPALHAGETRGDLVGFACADGQQALGQGAFGRVVQFTEVRRGLAQMDGLAVGHDRVDGQHIVAHGAVTQGAAAAGIVAGHAADGGARGSGDIHRKPKTVLFEQAVQIVQHDARLHHAAAVLDIQRDQLVEVLGAVDHQAAIDGLSALGCAAPARGGRSALLARQGQGAQGRLRCARDDHPGRGHLIVRGVGGVAATGEGIEQHLAVDFGLQSAFKAWIDRCPHQRSPGRLLLCAYRPGKGAARQAAT